ncbi:Aste57867_20014 [Aphanomyces stellatus]|uniref:Aste57867_20014 protein n=1 Tax=Aphanomyces stellatus TaxID=120398 RepID=A0A485LEK6_9STRA|nr:hypothetical protein As57867_019948 [Aphanomyces stellatus]VFT96710.1 Aste57867_20014 [Aphanomyces stellatus]
MEEPRSSEGVGDSQRKKQPSEPVQHSLDNKVDGEMSTQSRASRPPRTADLLTDLEKEHFTNVAKHMTQALLAETNYTQVKSWKLIHDKQVQIYCTEASSLGPCKVHAVTEVDADINDIADALITTTTDAYKTMMTMLSSDFIDGTVLSNIMTPTAENPHRYVGLKWAAFKNLIPSKDKDFIILEYIDLIENTHGQKTLLRIMQSVDVPASLKTAATQERHWREHVPLEGFIFCTTPTRGKLLVTYSCNFDTKGDLPAWAANSRIQSHVEKCFTNILQYIQCQTTFELSQIEKQVPVLQTDTCLVCEKKFSFHRHSYNCLECAKSVCSNCSSFRTTTVPELSERKLRVCTFCVLQVRQGRRGSPKIDTRPHQLQLDNVLQSVRLHIETDFKLFSSQNPSVGRTVDPPNPNHDKKRSKMDATDLQSSLAQFNQAKNNEKPLQGSPMGSLSQAPRLGFDEFLKQIRSAVPASMWTLWGDYSMLSNEIGTNSCIFEALDSRQMSKPLIAYLLKREPPNLDALKVMQRISNVTNHFVEIIGWGCINHGFFAIIVECGDANCKQLLPKLQSHATTRARCLNDVAKSIEILHSNFCVHGNIQLQNVVLSVKGVFKLSGVFESIKQGNIMTQRYLDGPEYCPPEMARWLRGGPVVVASPSIDIWCLGVVALKLFLPNGKLLELKELNSYDGVLDKLTEEQFSFETSVRSTGLDSVQQQLLLECLEPNLEKRAVSTSPILELLQIERNISPFSKLPFFWTLSIQHENNITPRGQRLKSLSCILGVVPIFPLSFETEDVVSLQADSAVVGYILPFLKCLKLFAEAFGLLEQLYGLKEISSFENVDLDALNHTITSLVTIHDSNKFSVEKQLSPLVEEIKCSRFEKSEAIKIQGKIIELLEACMSEPTVVEKSVWILENIHHQLGAPFDLWGLRVTTFDAKAGSGASHLPIVKFTPDSDRQVYVRRMEDQPVSYDLEGYPGATTPTHFWNWAHTLIGNTQSDPCPSQLEKWEFNLTLALCELSTNTIKKGETYGEFKLRLVKEYLAALKGIGINTQKFGHVPFVAHVDKRIRVILASVGSVVFVCSTGMNSLEAKDAFQAKYFVANSAQAPAVFVDDVHDLGLVPLVRTLGQIPDVTKVILCGHGRGGGVSHVAHYNLAEKVPEDKTIVSVAFGSPPVLKNAQINEKQGLFATFVLNDDVVPWIFKAKQLDLIRHGLDQTAVSTSDNSCDFDQFGEYEYVGVWGLLESKARLKDPTSHFKERTKTMSLIEVKTAVEDHHTIANAYTRHKYSHVDSPTLTTKVSFRVNEIVNLAGATCLVAEELPKAILPMVINKAIAATVVTRSSGDDTIFHALVQFIAALRTYRTCVHEVAESKRTSKITMPVDRRHKNNQKTVDELVAEDMEGWDAMKKRLVESQAKNEFNDSNISTTMNALAISTAAMMSENHLPMVKNNPGMAYADIIALGISMVVLGDGAGAAIGPLVAPEMSAVLAASIGGGVGLGVDSAFTVFTKMLEHGSRSSEATGQRARSEMYQVNESSYKSQLETLAKTMNCTFDAATTDVLALERMLIEAKIPEATESDSSNIAPYSFATTLPSGTTIVQSMNRDTHRIIQAYVATLRQIVELRKLCDKIVFIVISGRRGVGKSWFIQSINGQRLCAHIRTDYPQFFKYTPKGIDSPDNGVYLVDLPGYDSNNDTLRAYVQELNGLGSICINLLRFDVRPRNLTEDMQAMRLMFNGCDQVLVCLNKVMFSGLCLRVSKDPAKQVKALVPFLDSWRAYFEERGIKAPKYSIAATDITGTMDIRPEDVVDGDGGGYDRDDAAEYDSDDAAQYDFNVKRNLRTLIANGGASKNEVIDWINSSLKKLC